MIPLWEYLPSQYNNSTYITRMKNYYKTYVSNYLDSSTNNYKNNELSGDYTVSEFSVREGEVKITDAGRFKQHYDVINLDKLFKYPHSFMKDVGYKTMDITVTMQMRKISKGLQGLLLFNSTASSNDYYVDGHEFSYCGSTLGKEYGEVSYTFSGLTTSSFSDMLVLRYGASGTANDDWMNKDVRVKIVYHK